MYNPKPSHLLAALFVIVVSMLTACLWPFDFSPRNQVEWLKGENGLRFSSSTSMISSLEAFPPLSAISSDGTVTVEMAVRPTSLTSRYAPHILTLCPDQVPPSLVIGAWKDELIVRLGRLDATGPKKYREIGARKVFKAGETIFITIVTGIQGTAIYLDGRLSKEATAASITYDTPSLGRILIGIAPTGGGQWHGDLLGLTIYNRALSAAEVQESLSARLLREVPSPIMRDIIIARYDFTEDSRNRVRNVAGPKYNLVIPATFRPLQRTFLALPAGMDHLAFSAFQDISLNIIGFVPVGFVAMWTVSSLTIASYRILSQAVVCAGSLLSLCIELVQAFLPTRTSSLTDLCTNTMGTAIGVAAFFILTEINKSLLMPRR